MTTTVGAPGLRVDLDVLHLAEHARVHSVGCRTGRPHTTKVCFAGAGPTVHVLAHRRADGQPADWYRNLVGGGAAFLEVGDFVLPVSVVVPTDRFAAHRLAVGLFAEKYGEATVSGWHTSPSALPLRLDIVPGFPKRVSQS